MEDVYFVYAMSGEGARLEELLEEKYGEPSKTYLAKPLNYLENHKVNECFTQDYWENPYDDYVEISVLELDCKKRFSRYVSKLENYAKFDFYFYESSKTRMGLNIPIRRINNYCSKDKNIRTIHSNVGNENAKIVSDFIKRKGFDRVINMGLSGALMPELKLGDKIFSKTSLYYDGVNVHKTSIKTKPCVNECIKGITGTAPFFLEPANKKVFYEGTKALCVDVESAVLASELEGDVEIYRIISDPLSNGSNYFKENIEKSINYLNKVAEEVVGSL